jgi:hypothetical protein
MQHYFNDCWRYRDIIAHTLEKGGGRTIKNNDDIVHRGEMTKLRDVISFNR